MMWGTRLAIFLVHAGIGVVTTFAVVAILARRWKPAVAWFGLAAVAFALSAGLSGLLAAVDANALHDGAKLAPDEKGRLVAQAIAVQTVWVNLGLAAGVVMGIVVQRRKRA